MTGTSSTSTPKNTLRPRKRRDGGVARRRHFQTRGRRLIGLDDEVFDQIAVEVAVTSWDGQGFLRLSAQAYNSPADYARLAADLPALL
jgi:isopenicillin-N epimerase